MLSLAWEDATASAGEGGGGKGRRGVKVNGRQREGCGFSRLLPCRGCLRPKSWRLQQCGTSREALAEGGV